MAGLRDRSRYPAYKAYVQGVIAAFGRDDRVLAVLPFFHIYGMTVLLNLALRQRATLVTMPRFDLREFLRTVQEHRCTFLFIAPPIAVALAALIDCCVAPLSCEAMRGDDTTFDVPASGDRMSATDDHGATGPVATKPERRGGTDVSAGEARNAVAITSHGPAASAATTPY